MGNSPLNFTDPSGEFAWLAAGAALGAGIDLGVQLASNGRDFSDVNWTTVVASGVAGAAGAGLGNAVGNLTTNLIWRAGLNGLGSAAIGAGSQLVENAINGSCLGDGVIDSALLSGAFGAGGSVVGDTAQNSWIAVNKALSRQAFDRLSLDLKLLATSRSIQISNTSNPGSTFGTAVGNIAANSAPVLSFIPNDK